MSDRPAPMHDRHAPLTAGIRREWRPDPDAVGEDAGLVERIRAEIASGGPMPFDRFMALALYDPEGGYYRAAEARPGRAGDFLTAPEAHPIFGWTLARAVEDAWRRLGEPADFVLREYGAGTGTLALAILDGLARSSSPLADRLRYDPVEVEDRRYDAIAERLSGAGHGPVVVDPAARERPMTGLVLANEVLDALPVHRVRQRGDRLVEVAVTMTADGAFAELEIDPTTQALADRLAQDGIALVDGQTAEICLELEGWLGRVAAGLERGLAIAIDYGAPADRLYDPIRRRDGTLRGFIRQTLGSDPLAHVGRQDLTAHVDLTATVSAAESVGMTHLGTTSQGEYLVGLGAETLLREVQADPATTLEAYLPLRSALMRLIDPGAMGRFAVLAFGRDWPADDRPPLGFDIRVGRPAR